jgi:hypothetical protein
MDSVIRFIRHERLRTAAAVLLALAMLAMGVDVYAQCAGTTGIGDGL